MPALTEMHSRMVCHEMIFPDQAVGDDSIRSFKLRTRGNVGTSERGQHRE